MTPTEREAMAREMVNAWDACELDHGGNDLIAGCLEIHLAAALESAYARGRAAGIAEGRSDCHESCCWDPQKCHCNDRALLTAEEKS